MKDHCLSVSADVHRRLKQASEASGVPMATIVETLVADIAGESPSMVRRRRRAR